ncbi:MAG: hypothetical protein OHK0024_04570 [Thalassobaculales bacterium]
MEQDAPQNNSAPAAGPARIPDEPAEYRFSWLKSTYLGAGRSERRPFKILMPILSDSFGEVCHALLIAARIQARFDHALMTFYYRKNRPFKNDLVSLYPYPFEVMHPKTREGVPIDVFGGRPFWDPEDLRWQDCILSPRMIGGPFTWGLGNECLRVHPVNEPKLHSALLRLGLSPDKWFAVIHYRESTYKHKAYVTNRDSSPANYEALANYIIDELGGQVVRLGHPEMRPFTPRKGFVDLARIPDSTRLQALACARARFGITGSAGATCLMGALGLPAVITEALEAWSPLCEEQYLLTQTLVLPDGRRLRQRALLEADLLWEKAIQRSPEGSRLIKCSVAELQAAARFMLERTPDTPAWRPNLVVPPNKTNRLELPHTPEIEPKFFDPPPG